VINIYPSLTAPFWWVTDLIWLGALVGALTAIIKFVPPFWRIVVRFVTTVNALADLPQFMITTARTLADQDAGAIIRDKKIEEIHHEVKYNNGSSVKDAIKRVEEGVAGLYDKTAATDLKTIALADELERTRPPITRSAVRLPRKRPTA
jgi:hypothetical protein